MAKRNFIKMLENQWSKGNFVCVGLDSEFTKIPRCAQIRNVHRELDIKKTLVQFNCAIIKATRDLVCAYKPNTAFYEAYGSDGIEALQQTIASIHTIAPDVPVILDAKRGDIGNTNAGYVSMAFDFLQADAITLHSYLGSEALEPFLERSDKGIFVLCRTSNLGAGELQDLTINVPVNGIPSFIGNIGMKAPRAMPLYQYLAYRVSRQWNRNGNCALVVGATYPDELRDVREIVGDMPILIPGIGAQGGDVGKTVSAGKDAHGQGMVINSSRAIIFASQNEDFAEIARDKTKILHNLINQYR
ncbi:MAG: orotidine-5'-phosphate decarboxylase [Candidatus Moranbacteria bacterium]|nr:orotidine-5'-phosphate decarboxylase [Candidatus Moranbacteria bacterium]